MTATATGTLDLRLGLGNSYTNDSYDNYGNDNYGNDNKSRLKAGLRTQRA